MRRIPPDQRRDELVAAAVRVIARSGVAGATTRAVAAEAGMPLGAIHSVFGSQDDLMRAVVQAVTDEERLTAEIRTADATSLEAALRSGLESYVDLLEADPQRELALLELALFARRQDPDGQMRDQWRTYYATARDLLRYAATLTGTEWTTPVEALARHLVAVLDGMTTTWLADHDSAAARETAAFAAAALAAHARPAHAGTAPVVPATQEAGRC